MNLEVPDDFVIEAAELLDDAEVNLIHLDSGEGFLERYNTIFRAFHSLKGAAGMFGLEQLQKHMHFFEDLLEKSKKDQKLSQAKLDYFLLAVDVAKKSLRGEHFIFNYYDPDIEIKEATSLQKKIDPEIEEKEPEVVKSVSGVAEKEKITERGILFIVDDEKEICELVSFVLTEHHYRCFTFSNPCDVILKIEESGEKPDAIISDFRMPEMTGLELMQEVHKRVPLMPFILISGFINKNVAMDAIVNGVTSIIEKPIDDGVLLKSVENAVRKYQAVKIMNKSIDIILYQYADLESFLTLNKKDSVKDMLKRELKTILEQRKLLFSKGSK